MLDRLLRFFRLLIPKPLFRVLQPFYHFGLALVANLFYGFPGRKISVIGVTGTGGKTTVVHLLGAVFQANGEKVAWSSSYSNRMGDIEKERKERQTMPGRFKLVRLLAEARKRGVDRVILEVTSEGIKQFRHWGIRFEAAVFTNLSPEHIEAHGGFEKYRKAKEKLFRALKGRGIMVVNLDDPHVEHVLKYPAERKIGYSSQPGRVIVGGETVTARISKVTPLGNEFRIGEEWVFTPLLGRFNISNVLAAAATAHAFDVPWETISRAVRMFKGIPGRMERIHEGQPFSVFVDYAFTPDALQKVYEAIQETHLKESRNRMLCIIGGTGGGRDTWKRPELGRLAARYCQEVFVTTEDPYDEDPENIIAEVAKGAEEAAANGSSRARIWKISSRRDAIQKAINMSAGGDVVMITGKGRDPIMGPKGSVIPWDDREEARKAIRERLKKERVI